MASQANPKPNSTSTGMRSVVPSNSVNVRFSLGRYHLESSDHIPIAALGMVVELSNRISRRQPLDAPFLRHDALVARYDERSGVRGHGTPKRCIYPPIRTYGF